MKKTLITLLITLTPLLASAQTTGQLIPFLRSTNSTSTNATSTNLYTSGNLVSGSKLFIQDGAFNAPAITFFNETNTGLYHPSSGVLGLTALGAGLSWDGNTGTLRPNGDNTRFVGELSKRFAGFYSVLATTTSATSTNFFSTSGTFTTVCLTGDVCRTTWPTGGGSGGGNSKWATSTDNVSIYPNASQKVGIGSSTPYARLDILSSSASEVGEVIKGASSQSANLMEWENSAGTKLAYISPEGRLTISEGVGSFNLTLHKDSGDSNGAQIDIGNSYINMNYDNTTNGININGIARATSDKFSIIGYARFQSVPTGGKGIEINAPLNGLDGGNIVILGGDTNNGGSPRKGGTLYLGGGYSSNVDVGYAPIVLQPNGGNIGIGTSTPYAKLTVAATDLPLTTPLFVVATSSTALATSTVFDIKGQNYDTISLNAPAFPIEIFKSGGSQIGAVGSGFVANDDGTGISMYSNGKMRFAAGTTNAGIVLKQCGSATCVGMGTDDPVFQLHIYSNATAAALLDGPTSPIFGLDIAGVAFGTFGSYGGTTIGANNSDLGFQSSNSIGFTTNGTAMSGVRMFLNKTGEIVFSSNGGTTTPTLVLDTTRRMGVGSSTPFAKTSIHLNSTDTYLDTAFAIASSTPSATTTLFAITATGQILATSTSPVLSSCGTGPSMSPGTSNSHGTITVGATGGGCVVTFANAYASAPTCPVTPQTGSLTNTFSYSVTATAITVTEIGLGGNKFDYTCIGNTK